MAIGKRLRFQIFRRDNFACRYCGRTADAGAVLEVDHIKPRADGGKDHPTNLITACEGCNSGKSDIPLGAPVVDDVPQADFRLALVERGLEDPDPEPEFELTDWVHELDTAAAVRWYHGFGDDLPHPRLSGWFSVTFALALSSGYTAEGVLAAAEAAGEAGDGDLSHYLLLDVEGPEETAAFDEALTYIRGFIAVELLPLVWRARYEAGDRQLTYQAMVRATAELAREQVEERGRDKQKLRDWLRRLPKGEGSRFLWQATADWDAYWQGKPGHSAHESPDEVLELAIGLALNAPVPTN